jgi:hypothetical protein
MFMVDHTPVWSSKETSLGATMALGTITKPSPNPDYAAGNKKVRVRDIQLTSGANYTTGGETITAAAVGMRRIESAMPMGLALPSGGATSRSVAFILGNGVTNTKMLVHTTASAEAASNSDQSTFSVRVKFEGI